MKDLTLKKLELYALERMIQSFQEAGEPGYTIEMVKGNAPVTVPDGYSIEGGQDSSANTRIKIPEGYSIG